MYRSSFRSAPSRSRLGACDSGPRASASGFSAFFSIRWNATLHFTVAGLRMPCLPGLPTATAPGESDPLCHWGKIRCLLVQLEQETLYGLDFAFLEMRLAALATHPGWYSIEGQMVPLTTDVERSVGSLHLSLAMDTLHNSLLVLSSGPHSATCGRYAVMMGDSRPSERKQRESVAPIHPARE